MTAEVFVGRVKLENTIYVQCNQHAYTVQYITGEKMKEHGRKALTHLSGLLRSAHLWRNTAHL